MKKIVIASLFLVFLSGCKGNLKDFLNEFIDGAPRGTQLAIAACFERNAESIIFNQRFIKQQCIKKNQIPINISADDRNGRAGYRTRIYSNEDTKKIERFAGSISNLSDKFIITSVKIVIYYHENEDDTIKEAMIEEILIEDLWILPQTDSKFSYNELENTPTVEMLELKDKDGKLRYGWYIDKVYGVKIKLR